MRVQSIAVCVNCSALFAPRSDSRGLYCSPQCWYAVRTAKVRATSISNFWAKVDKNGPILEHRPELGPCWIWTGNRQTGGGYGTFIRDKHVVYAHRFSYELAHGPLGDLSALHHCDNPPCVNNEGHLFSGTDADNHSDMVAKGRGVNPPRVTGDRHWTRQRPEDAAAGLAHWRSAHPGEVLRGERVGTARLTPDLVRAIRAARAAGEHQRDVAARFGVAQGTVWYVTQRITWKHVT